MQVPTKVFSLKNSTAYAYPKENMCVLLELGPASGMVTLHNCDVLLHFMTERDMQIFLQQRRRALADNQLLPPPDGIFYVWIVFNSQNRTVKGGRYALQIDRQAMLFRKKEKDVNGVAVEMKLIDCRFQMHGNSIRVSCFWGDIEIFSADELQGMKDLISNSFEKQ